MDSGKGSDKMVHTTAQSGEDILVFGEKEGEKGEDRGGGEQLDVDKV